jgi:hypothetical protein
MGCGPSSEAGATDASGGGAGGGGAGGGGKMGGSKSTSIAGPNAGKKFGDSYKLGKEVRACVLACLLIDRERSSSMPICSSARRARKLRCFYPFLYSAHIEPPFFLIFIVNNAAGIRGI